jgi:hypothetical protein
MDQSSPGLAFGTIGVHRLRILSFDAKVGVVLKSKRVETVLRNQGLIDGEPFAPFDAVHGLTRCGKLRIWLAHGGRDGCYELAEVSVDQAAEPSLERTKFPSFCKTNSAWPPLELAVGVSKTGFEPKPYKTKRPFQSKHALETNMLLVFVDHRHSQIPPFPLR